MALSLYLLPWRRLHGVTQAQLAQRAGLTQAAVSQLERQRRVPTLRTLARLAAALDVAPGELLTRPIPYGLSRAVADRAARSIVSGERRLPLAERQLVDAIGALVIQKLRAHRAPGRFRYVRSRWAAPRRPLWVRQMYGTQIPTQILRRIDKLLLVPTKVPRAR